ncbi:aurora kinase A- and ninein-interacting protein [Paralichthys olivaceus]|uniref:aurora kinase A- and ninein-interacting protein n=1 Tax=Paralichthys olivaceus TaxID=8255 RepID=UPI003753A597
MKTSKPARKAAAQEECGVWLDTVQLKGKAKQKRLARRPISKLLNPFAEAGGYSLAVALNFTQTKMEMPKTKQSSISAFFTPQPRDLNEKSASDKPNMDPMQSSSSASTSTAPVASGTKRRRGAHLENSDSEPGVDKEWESENVTEPEETLWLEQGETALTQNSYCQSEEEQPEELNPPQSKRRFTDTSFLPDDSQPLPQAWSQDPLLTYSQYSDSESFLNNQKNTTEENFSDCFLNSLKSEGDFGLQMDRKGKTSTQKSFKNSYSSQLEDEKENSRYLFSKSPRKHSPFSHIEPVSNNKWTEAKTASPRKHIRDQLWKRTDDDESSISQFKWTKPSSANFKKPARKQQSREADEDSLSMLFTQDSEGFRVIAHRVRSPLKDPSNFSTGVVRTSSYKSSVEEEEMLFTQDSQGNMVIKH